MIGDVSIGTINRAGSWKLRIPVRNRHGFTLVMRHIVHGALMLTK
jgi:hypothetical protein